MTRDRMDNTGFEGGEAVLLAARGLPGREVINGGGVGAPRGGGGGGGGGRRADRAGPVALEVRNPGGPPPVTQTNGGPHCHCSPQEARGDYRRESSKSPSIPMPIVAQESPWHNHKSIYLAVIVVTLVLWVVIYTIISELNLA